MSDQDLTGKYQPVADFMSQRGFQIEHFHVQDGKAVLTAKAPTEYLKNRAWDEIKKIDPAFNDLQHNITVQDQATYVIKPGDNLTSISQHFYGAASQFAKISQANNISDPDKIKVGQTLKIPAA
jgi:nucleoid-associated protein YgaU